MVINIKNPTMKRYLIKDKEPLIFYDLFVKDLTKIFLEQELYLFKGNLKILHDKYILNYYEKNNKKIEDLNRKEKRELKEFIIKDLFKIVVKEQFIYLMFKNFYGKEKVNFEDVIRRFLEILGNEHKVKFTYKRIEKIEVEEVEEVVKEEILTEKEQEFKRRIQNDFNINIF